MQGRKIFVDITIRKVTDMTTEQKCVKVNRSQLIKSTRRDVLEDN